MKPFTVLATVTVGLIVGLVIWPKADSKPRNVSSKDGTFALQLPGNWPQTDEEDGTRLWRSQKLFIRVSTHLNPSVVAPPMDEATIKSKRHLQYRNVRGINMECFESVKGQEIDGAAAHAWFLTLPYKKGSMGVVVSASYRPEDADSPTFREELEICHRAIENGKFNSAGSP